MARRLPVWESRVVPRRTGYRASSNLGNGYTFVGNDPLDLVNPWGLCKAGSWHFDDVVETINGTLASHGVQHIQLGDLRWNIFDFTKKDLVQKCERMLTETDWEELRARGILDAIA